ncbi:hypothetical protein ACOME3_008617 [Neoechinorhynchus agilis]
MWCNPVYESSLTNLEDLTEGVICSVIDNEKERKRRVQAAMHELLKKIFAVRTVPLDEFLFTTDGTTNIEVPGSSKSLPSLLTITRLVEDDVDFLQKDEECAKVEEVDVIMRLSTDSSPSYDESLDSDSARSWSMFPEDIRTFFIEIERKLAQERLAIKQAENEIRRAEAEFHEGFRAIHGKIISSKCPISYKSKPRRKILTLDMNTPLHLHYYEFLPLDLAILANSMLKALRKIFQGSKRNEPNFSDKIKAIGRETSSKLRSMPHLRSYRKMVTINALNNLDSISLDTMVHSYLCEENDYVINQRYCNANVFIDVTIALIYWY